MTQRSLSVLIVLNVVLLAAIALTFGPVKEANAQLGGGNYLMIAGNASQGEQQVIYIIDGNGVLAALTVNSANGNVQPVDRRDIRDDIQNAGNGQGPR